MDEDAVKAELVESLQKLREQALAKLDGLSEYDVRRPMTGTGTNLLGVIKHLASVDAGYFGEVFGRPWPHPMPWFDQDAEINADMWATPQESADSIRQFYRDVWTFTATTFAEVGLFERGHVNWWDPDRNDPTLFTVLNHMIVETARHAGHLDIIRELIDARAGRFPGDRSLPGEDVIDWPGYVATVQSAADRFQDAG